MPSTFTPIATTTLASAVTNFTFSSTTKAKTIRNFNGQETNTNGIVSLTSGLWTSTSAITSILFNAGGYAFTTTTTFSLYGITG